MGFGLSDAKASANSMGCFLASNFPAKRKTVASGSMPNSCECPVLPFCALSSVFHEELIVHSMRRVGQLVFFESAPKEIPLVGLAHIKCAIDKSINPVEGELSQRPLPERQGVEEGRITAKPHRHRTMKVAHRG